jgi:hypothetical protein
MIAELIIEGFKSDIQNVDIILNKSIDDIMNPGDINTTTSRTISLPNTPTNNEIFGYIFNNNKDIIYYSNLNNIKNNFNPSKKAKYVLLYQGFIFESGYLKMSDIKIINKNYWTYNIILYNELIDIFNGFEDETLTDTLSKTGVNFFSTGLTSFLTANLILENYENELKNTCRLLTSYTTLEDYYDYLITANKHLDNKANFILSENGYYDDSSHAMFNNSVVEDNLKIADDLGTDVTEKYLKILRSDKQRLAVYTDLIIKECLKTRGYDLELDTDFVNIDNPYWYQTLLTLPLFEEKDITVYPSYYTSLNNSYIYKISGASYDQIYNYLKLNTNNHQEFGFYSGTTYNSGGYTRQTFRIENNLKINEGDLEIRFIPQLDTAYQSSDVNVDFVVGLSGSTTGYIDQTIGKLNTDAYIQIEIKLNCQNSELMTIYNCYLVNVAYQDNINNYYDCRFKMDASNSFTTQTMVRLESGTYQNLAYFLSQQLLKAKLNTSYISKLISSPNNYLEYDIQMIVSIISPGGTYPFLVTENTNTTIYKHQDVILRLNIPDALLTYTPTTKFGYNSEFSIVNSLNKLETKKFLLDYIRLFGLYMNVDYINKKISLETRNEFYQNYKILDWDEKINLEKEINIVPLNFNNQFIKISYKNFEDNIFVKNYQSKFKKEYGTKYLNTGFEFNNDEYDMLESDISQLVISDINDNIFNYDNDVQVGKQIILPYFVDDNISNVDNYSLIFFDRYVGYPSDYKRNTANDYNFNVTNQIYNQTTGVIADEQHYNMSNFTRIIDTKTNKYIIQNTGITSNSILINDNIYVNNFLKFDTYNSYFTPGSLYQDCYNNFYYKRFGSYVTNNSDYVQYSLDIIKPSALYYKTNITYNQNITVYDRFHKKFLEDRYNVNTRILTAYFYLTPFDVLNFNFKDFIKYDGCLWTVNKINDYNITLGGQNTKVELVKVNDINNYINSVNLS